MKKILITIILLSLLLFTFGCSNNTKEREIVCKAKCLMWCEQLNMTYIPSETSMFDDKCVISCVCQKRQEMTIVFNEG